MSAANAPTLLVLAAGMGSRYGGLKQLDPVGPSGETIMDYSVYDALRAGFGKIVFVLRQDIEQAFKDGFGTRFAKHIPVEYVFQELDKLPAGFSLPEGRTKPWGTTHAILMAKDTIHEPFAVINADDFYGAEGYRVLSEQLQATDVAKPDYAMVGFELRNTLSDFGSVARGVCQRNADGYLESVVELTSITRDGGGAVNTDPQGNKTTLPVDSLVSMNMWGFTPAIFPQLEDIFEEFLKTSGSEMKSECYIPNSVNSLVASGDARVKVLRTGDAWFGVTYREDRPGVVESIRKLVDDGGYPENLWA